MIFLILFIAIVVVLLFNLESFGQLPKGKRAQKIKSLTNYRLNALQNRNETPMKPHDVTYQQMIRKMLFQKHPDKIPESELPHKTPDFTSNLPAITWFGHSSYLLQLEGLNILVDPVFSKRTSPFQFIGTKAFKGTDFFDLSLLPAVDYIIITHDHYDHLDYNTIKKLKDSAVKFITSIGVGAHLERWGINPDRVSELSWGEVVTVNDQVQIVADVCRHFSGRGLKRNQSLWSAFIILTSNGNYYLGGDSGYDQHFKETGEKYGPFELVILECGQYNEMWPLIHMFPEQTVLAAQDLQAKKLMPVHWGKFALAMHPWDDSIKRVVAAAERVKLPLMTPYLGETRKINDHSDNLHWWSLNNNNGTFVND